MLKLWSAKDGHQNGLGSITISQLNRRPYKLVDQLIFISLLSGLRERALALIVRAYGICPESYM